MNAFIIDLAIYGGDWIEPPYFNSQKELNEYIGEEVPVKFDDDESVLLEYIDKWIESHKFSTLENNIEDYDLEKGYVEREIVYTVDDKYYRFHYTEWYDYEKHIGESEPVEVYPVEETVKITKYVTNRPNDKECNEV